MLHPLAHRLRKYSEVAATLYLEQGVLATQFVVHGRQTVPFVVDDRNLQTSKQSAQTAARLAYEGDQAVHTVVLMGRCLLKVARVKSELIEGLTAHDYPDSMAVLRVDVMQSDGTRRAQVAQIMESPKGKRVSRWIDCPLEVVGTDLLSLFWQTYHLMKCL